MDTSHRYVQYRHRYHLRNVRHQSSAGLAGRRSRDITEYMIAVGVDNLTVLEDKENALLSRQAKLDH